ncbi:uncharacterized protein LOC117649725 [Thrips palmi]|uniref:Uncharacterized protein LOC117649725 n=1 Tax=Thrips palmi TaxID=161013 RepID=A0A6P8ZUG5_THRPL|nr:uncharacterized protein LOC117649725 [Thrips palmi]XP_034248601.1 uncharacterized protein LOC117649725 [Thrips palmi]
MWVTMWAVLSLAVLAVAAAHAAPTSAIVGGLETSLLDGRTQGQGQGQGQDQAQPQGPVLGRPTTARLERVYSSSVKAGGKVKAGVARPATESYARTGNRVHLTPAGTPSENPAPCAIGGRHFLHGQQVTRSDPCEFCVCLDGEVFCWWQDCPPSTAQGPCRGRPAFSSCQDDATATAASATATSATEQASAESDDASQNETSTVSATPPAATDTTSPSRGQQGQQLQTTGALQDPTTNPQPAVPGLGDQPASSGTEAASAATGPDNNGSVHDGHAASTAASAASAANTTTTSVPTTTELMCHVLGSSYRVGEVLPRDTGSCLQCECSPVGRVTCSPKDCLSVREEEDVYQPASSLDMFDVDSF